MKTLESLATESLDNSAQLLEHIARSLLSIQSKPETRARALESLIEDAEAAQGELTRMTELLRSLLIEEGR